QRPRGWSPRSGGGCSPAGVFRINSRRVHIGTCTLPRGEVRMFDLGEFLHYHERVRARTRRVAACIPADQIEWSYRPGPVTLGDLVRHIAVTERFIWAETVHNRPSRYTAHGRDLAEGRDAVLAFLDRLHEESIAEFRKLTPEMLAAKCATPEGTPLTTW